MTPFFDRLDLASDAAFLLWAAGLMVAIGLVIGAYMVGKRAWRWVGRRKDRAVRNRLTESYLYGWRCRRWRQ